MPSPDEQEALVQRHFGGDRALHAEYLALCRQQFVADAQAGDAACASAAGLPDLRRLAHSLKTVLHTLGHEDSAQLAVQLEEACLAQEPEQARALWQLFRQGILAI